MNTFPNGGLLMKSIENNFMTQSKFTKLVEETVLEGKGLINYIDAIISVCDEYNIEIDTVGKLIAKPLKDKIKFLAQELNYMKKTSRGILHL